MQPFEKAQCIFISNDLFSIGVITVCALFHVALLKTETIVINISNSYFWCHLIHYIYTVWKYYNDELK